MKIKAPGFRIRSSHSVAFSPDGEHLATIGRDVVLWSVSSRKRLRSNSMLKHPQDVAFSPSGRSFCIKNTLGEILTCETASADPVERFIPEQQDEGPRPVYYGEDHLIDGSWSGQVRVRHIDSLAPHVVWSAEQTMVTEVLRSSAGTLWAFAVSAKHGHPEFESGADRIFTSTAPETGFLVSLPRRWSLLRSAALSPSGEYVAVRFDAGEHIVEMVDARSSETLATTTAIPGGTGWRMHWSPEGDYLILIERGGFSFRSASDLQEVGWLPSEFASDVAFSPSGQLVALGDWSNGFVAPWPALLTELGPRTTGIVP